MKVCLIIIVEKKCILVSLTNNIISCCSRLKLHCIQIRHCDTAALLAQFFHSNALQRSIQGLGLLVCIDYQDLFPWEQKENQKIPLSIGGRYKRVCGAGPGPSFFCSVSSKQRKTSENRMAVAAFDSCLEVMSDS